MIVSPLIVSALRGEYREKPARETRTRKKEAGRGQAHARTLYGLGSHFVVGCSRHSLTEPSQVLGGVASVADVVGVVGVVGVSTLFGENSISGGRWS